MTSSALAGPARSPAHCTERPEWVPSVGVSDLEPRPEPDPLSDPRDLRCSDADREAVAEVLRKAAGDGRLTLDELGDRLDVVYAARTYRDLEPAIRDLPGAAVPGLPVAPAGVVAPRGPSEAAHVPTDVNTSAVAIFSEAKRTGRWLVPSDYASVAVFGSVLLDLREASTAGPHTQIQANAIFGEVKVIVGDDITVSTIGTPVLGEYNGPHEEPEPGKTHLVLNGLALFGSVEVKRKGPKKKWRS